MKIILNKDQTGFAFGLLSCFLYLIWLIIALSGKMSTTLALKNAFYFINISYIIYKPDIVLVISGIVLSLTMGFILGWVFALLWNFVGKKMYHLLNR
jgi:tetrahydromethanopterin S-methyltransferase subunit F